MFRLKMETKLMKLGFHVSISDGIDKSFERAQELGCETFQIFTRNPRSWKSNCFREGEAEAFKQKKAKSKLGPIFDHMPYIQNIASPNDLIYSKSIESLKIELKRCTILDIPFMVTHLGSHLGSGSERGISRATKAINEALSEVKSSVIILIENSSGSGGQIGATFNELKQVLDEMVEEKRVAVCLDTCHAFSYGYDLRTENGLSETLSAFDEFVGLNQMKLIHLNDSVGELGSKIDHHEHIGLGKIGKDGFKTILKSMLSRLPMIMETPEDGRRSDGENMRMVRELATK